MAEFTFDAASHTYLLDGARLPSVTEIISPIRQDFSMIGAEVLEAKRALGTAVHLACEFDDLGELDDAETDSKIMGYVHAWRKFKSDTSAIILFNEQRMYHEVLRFAGTVDRVAALELSGALDTWIIDIKTSEEAHPSYGVQLAGYALLLEAFERINWTKHVKHNRASVHLRSDGTYRMHRYQQHIDESAFRACLALNHWKETTK